MAASERHGARRRPVVLGTGAPERWPVNGGCGSSVTSSHPRGRWWGTRELCEVSAAVTGLSGAGITVMMGDVNQGSLGASDAVSRTIEDLQFALGEGPCIDAHRDQRPVLEPDLLGALEPRWPAFATAGPRRRRPGGVRLPAAAGRGPGRRAGPLP